MLAVGDKYECDLTITPEQERLFMELTGDTNPVHTSGEEAQKATGGVFAPIAHGMLVASMIGKVMGMDFPGNRTINMERSFTFIRPLFVNEHYTMHFKVSEIDHDACTGTIKFSIKDQNKKICLTGSTLVKNIEKFGD